MKTEKPFVFSSLFAEDEAYLQAYIDNFTLFAKPEDYLIINSTVKLDTGKYKQFSQVHFIYHEKPRAKWGATLLQSHVENYQYAKKTLNHDNFIFINTSSNALFFRSYDKQKILDRLEIHFEKLGDLDGHTGWIFEHIKKNKNITDFLGRKYTWGQIEGLTTHSENWQIIEKIIDQLVAISEKPPFEELPPYEEFVPLTVLLKENRTFTHICHMLWGQSREGDYNVNLNDIFNPPADVNDYAAIYKWFPRNVRDITTAAVCQPELYKSLTGLYAFSKNNQTNLNFFELGNSFLKNIPSFAAASYEPYEFNTAISKKLDRKVVNFSDHDSKSPFLFFEFLSEDIEGNLTIKIQGDRVQVNSDIRQGGATNRIYFDYKFYCILYIPLIDNLAKEIMLKYHDTPIKKSENPATTTLNTERIHATSQLLNFSYCSNKNFYEKSNNFSSSYKNALLKPVHIFEMHGQQNRTQKYIGIPIMNKLNITFSVLSIR
ncbi:hypothetical protein G6644_08690 [Polynucleobacter paneuropaeus]|nr:hypothetical protein [Polynucleobacter paneuropaeus]MBT8638573.1 hypothetical protein [Polynucleobacter paneuropaeus]